MKEAVEEFVCFSQRNAQILKVERRHRQGELFKREEQWSRHEEWLINTDIKNHKMLKVLWTDSWL